MWNLHNTDLYRSWHINRQQETLWKQCVNYFHFALWQLLSESILFIVIKEHYANCYCWTPFKKLSWYTVQNCKHSVCTRTCKSLPTFDAKIYYVQIRCYMFTICRKRNYKIVYEIKNIPETGWGCRWCSFWQEHSSCTYTGTITLPQSWADSEPKRYPQ